MKLEKGVSCPQHIYNLVCIVVIYLILAFTQLITVYVFVSQEGIVEKLFKWAQEAEQPLRIYATGLLAGAMENQDIAANYREENSVLVSGGHWLLFMQILRDCTK